MTRPIRMADAQIRGIDRSRILTVLNSGQFSPGPFCREFEEKFAAAVGRKHALFLNSGTDALRISLLALKEKHFWADRSKVLVPAITFPATLNVVLQANLTPYLLDAGPQMVLPDSPPVGAVAILPVHLMGRLEQMPEILHFAGTHGLKVLEDSCEMFGESAGLWGDCAAFSTYQCHHLATGVGGVAVCDDDELNELMRSYANHGRDPSYLPGFRSPPISKELLSARFRYQRVGYSARATEFQAALGLGQLERCRESLLKRRHVAKALIQSLATNPNFQIWDDPKHTWFAFPIVLNPSSKLLKADVCWALEQAGIETRDLMPITHQPVFQPFVRSVAYQPRFYPEAEALNQRAFYVPCHPGMSLSDVKHIVKVLFTLTNSLK